jgi:hypothetical protein
VDSASDRSGRLQALIGEYLDAVQSGRPIDRAVWLAAHSDLADRLRSFLADYDRFRHLAAPLREVAGAAPTMSHDGESFSTGSLSSSHGTSDAADPAASPDSGTRLGYFCDYELLRRLDEGGMGVVFEARQQSLDRISALKMIRAGRFASAEDLRRFRSEAEAVAGLDHPHQHVQVVVQELRPRFQAVKVAAAGVNQILQEAQAIRASLGLPEQPEKGHDLGYVPADVDRN